MYAAHSDAIRKEAGGLRDRMKELARTLRTAESEIGTPVSAFLRRASSNPSPCRRHVPFSSNTPYPGLPCGAVLAVPHWLQWLTVDRVIMLALRACLLCGTAMVTRAKEERAAETHLQTEAMLQRLESALCEKLQVGTTNASAAVALASP